MMKSIYKIMKNNAISLPEGYFLYHYKDLPSTNSEAVNCADKGMPGGTVILADMQTEGRGRQSKIWISKSGNLYFSLIVKHKLHHISQLAFISAVAVGEVIRQLFSDSPEANVQYKWPNDILVNGEKICGILLETNTINKEKVDWIVVGMGVNILSAPHGGTAISYYYKEKEISNLQLLEMILKCFNSLINNWKLNGFLQIQNMWMKNAYNIDKEIQIKIGEKSYVGKFMGIDMQGRIILNSEGNNSYFDFGEIFL